MKHGNRTETIRPRHAGEILLDLPALRVHQAGQMGGPGVEMDGLQAEEIFLPRRRRETRDAARL